MKADLRGADLRGADLRGANLRCVNLKDPIYDDKTKFPSDFLLKRREIMTKKGEEEESQP